MDCKTTFWDYLVMFVFGVGFGLFLVQWITG